MSESKTRSSSLHPDSFQKPGSACRAIRGGLVKAFKRTFRRWGLLSFLALICLGLGILAAQWITSFKQFAEEQAKIDTDVLAPQNKPLEDQISKLKAERAEYLSKNGILDPGEQRTKSKNRISYLETQLDQLNIASTGFKSELEHIKKRQQQAHIDISQIKMEEERDEMVQDAVTDSRRRQDRIHQLLKEEETRIELEATLAAKEKEKTLVDDLIKQNKAGRID